MGLTGSREAEHEASRDSERDLDISQESEDESEKQDSEPCQPSNQPTLNSRPLKKKILEIIPHVAPYWYELGIQLLNVNQESHLELIQSNHSNDNERCCMKMFWYWLKTHPKATWQQLIDSLRSPALELHTVADNIEAMFTEHSQQQMVQQDKQDGAHADLSADTPTFEINFNQFERVSTAFITLTSNLTILLRKADFHIIRRSCLEQINTPNGAQLLPEDVTSIKASKNVDELLDVLAVSAYWSWIDVRLLQAMVDASNNKKAINLIERYKNAIFKKKLKDVLPDAPGKEIKEAYYTKIVSKVDKDPDDITVEDLLKFQSQLETVIMDIKNGVCILEHLEKGCIEVHWYIPTSCVDGAYRSARVKRHQFNDLHLQYLKIGHYPVIHHPLASPDVIVSAPSPPINVATVKDFIDHYYDYLSVNMDPEVVTQLMVSQQLLSKDVVMTACSDYLKNCLILQQVRLMNVQSLLSFGESLKAIDSHKHIGAMFVDGLRSSLMSPNTTAQSAVDQDDIATEHIEQRDKEELATKNDMIDPSSVITEFLNMKVQLEELLQQCDPLPTVKKCGSLQASNTHNIPLFPTDYTEKLQEIQHTPELIQKLSPFMTWDNHTILSTIAADIPEATMLLTQFEDRIDSSQPLTSFPIPAPSHHMVPYDNSTHTVLAVKLDLELYQSTLQNIIDARSLIQDQCKLTSHCLQLLAVAKTNSTIIYWMIPRSIAHLFTVNFQNYHQKGILQLAVYPGAMLCTGSALKIGPLSFLNQLDAKLESKNASVSLNIELSQVEKLPQVVSKLHNELIKKLTKVAVGNDETRRMSQQYDDVQEVHRNNKSLQKLVEQLKADKIMLEEQLKDLDTKSKLQTEQISQKQLHEKIANIKLENAQLNDQNDQLKLELQEITKKMAVLKDVEMQSIHLKAQIEGLQKERKAFESKEKEKYEDLYQKYEKVLFSSEEVEAELSWLQKKVVDVKAAFGSIDVVKLHVLKHSDDKSSENSSELFSGKKETFCGYFQMLKRELQTLEEWPKLLQVELMDNAKKISSLQEENKMLEREILALSEENESLVKQFRQKKEGHQKRQQLLQKEQLIKIDQLGSGQFGKVSKITYAGKLYAGKSIYPKHIPGYPKSSVDQIKQFAKEFESKSAAYSYFSHSNIELVETAVQLPSDSLPMLLSELLPENLEMFTTRTKGNLPIHQQLDLCEDMANGLQYLHDAGLVHTNLHGRNVLIGHDGHAKIGDYICPQVIFCNEEVPTYNIPYLSPEAIKDKSNCNEQSDIYSLGVLFLQVAIQTIPEPTDIAELSKLKQRREELGGIGNHPLVSLIQRCITNIRVARPSIVQVLEQIITAKESPQSVISSSLHCSDSPEFGHSLQSGKYALQWTRCSKLPTTTYGAHSTVIGLALYVCGGWCPNDTMNIHNVYRYDLSNNQWSVLPPLQQYYGIPVNLNDSLAIIGGKHSTAKKATNLVTAYNIDNNSWNNAYPNLTVPRFEPAVVPYNRYVIVAGGKDDDGTILNSIEVFDVEKSHWTIVTTCLPEPMYNISATLCGDSFTIVGYTYTDGDRSNRTFLTPIHEILPQQQTQQSLSPQEDNAKWHELAETSYWFTALVPNISPPIIIGGSDEEGNTVGDIAMYDDTTKSWENISSLPIKCSLTTVAVINQSIIVIGGSSDVQSSETCDATALCDVNIGKLVVCDDQ